MHDAHLTAHRAGFPFGETTITREDAAAGARGAMDFAIVRLRAGESIAEASDKETAWVLLDGAARVSCDGGAATEVSRSSLFDERPSVVSLPRGARVVIEATRDSEWARARASNARGFAARLFLPGDTSSEARGQGLVQDASLRIVRLSFDYDARPDSELVIGEVIHLPGRWSSYPPHHHAQPELYHYRFDKPQGYGHAELGDDVVKVRPFDTVVIDGGLDHPQVAAPGYAMYYLWIVRHAAGAPYRGFTFTDEHKWILDGKDAGWRPRELK